MLIGNPNCGKTTLFNKLTGSRQHTANHPGVTVEAKSGLVKTSKTIKIHITDLPGTYSISSYTAEEKIVSDMLLNKNTDVIINIIDVMNLERSLYLTTQLMQLGIPIILVPNMLDILEKNGGNFDYELLKSRLNIPIIPISAAKGIGIKHLIDMVIFISENKKVPHISKLSNAEDRYNFIKKLTDKVVAYSKSYVQSTAYKIDKIVLNKYLSLPIFFAIIFLIFFLTFGSFGNALRESLEYLLNTVLKENLNDFLTHINCNQTLISLINSVVFDGIGSVLSFLPQTTILFGMISVLEDSGYMARAAFTADKLLKGLGISGKAFVPLVMGFGCTVPAVMTSRVLENPSERRIAVMITPFMSCPAKMPVYLLLTSYFFRNHAIIIVFSLYTIGIVTAIITAKLLGKSTKEKSSFILELPPYRLPSLKSVTIHIITKIKDFLIKAGTVIPIATLIIWFMQNHSFNLNTTSYENSILYLFGNTIAPLFSVCGFNNSEATISLITGIAARETSAATLGLLTASCGIDSVFTPLSAYSFMVFVLLCPPCIAALSTMYKELKSFKYLFMSIIYQLFVAWLISGCIYQFGSLIYLISNN